MAQKTFIKSPGLPEGKVASAILTDGCPKILVSALKSLGCEVCFLSPDSRFDGRISHHSDIHACHLGGNAFVVSQKQPSLEMAGGACVLSDCGFSDKYPFDCCLNAAVVGKYVFCKESVTDRNILSFGGREAVNVKQGYAKCSVAPVCENALITDDGGIASAASSRGFDVLLTEKGQVLCDGYDCGFIGGSCGKLSKNAMAFTGKFKDDRIRLSIEAFLQKHDVRPIYLTENELFDVGSIIPVKEII